jgi:hypothetical protein
MKRLLLACLLLLLLLPAHAQEVPPFQLSADQKARIGKKIWANECGGRIDGLTSWNYGEEFPSLGIGHFIWYPEGFQGPFEESFHKLIAYAQERGANPPAVALKRHCPWRSKAEFEAALNGPELKALRGWLATSIGLQTDFIISRSRAALGKMKEAAPADQADRLERNYAKVATTTNGVYALIDYVNFKGEGTNPKERYNGQGWGLMWVLLEMKDVPAGQPAAREFAASAKRVLDRRIANSPPDRGEERWRQGWHNRCEGYTAAF